MKIIKGFQIFLVFNVILFSTDFQNITFGTRVLGLSGAYTGLSDDIQSIYNNPSGLAFIASPVAFTEAGTLHWGLTDESKLVSASVAFAHTYMSYGTLAYAWQSFSLLDWYQEHILSISWARKIFSKFYFGLSLKPMFQKYQLDEYMKTDPTFDYGNKTGLFTIGIDQGLLYEFYNRCYFGLSFINLNQPNIGFVVTEQLPLTTKIGFGIKHIQPNIGVDVVFQRSDYMINLGVEHKAYKDIIVVRGGVGIGNNQYFNLSLGTTFNIKNLKVEYAFVIPKIEKNYGTHKVSISYIFGVIPPEGVTSEEYKKLFEESENLRSEIKNLQEQLKSTVSRKELEEKLKESERLVKERDILKKQVISLEEKLKAKKSEEGTYPTDEINRLNEKIKELETQVEQKEKALQEALNTIKTIKKQTPAPTKPPKPKLRTHKVEVGETLMSISQKYYGTPERWKDIYEANKSKLPKGQITPGQILTIP